jgi:hypothetical protein
VIFAQFEGFRSRYLLVILDGASGPPALRACLAPAGGAVNFDSDESSRDQLGLAATLACMIISL